MLIRAENEADARNIASSMAADEGAAVWLSEKKTTCTIITKKGKEEVIIASFHAG
jgi:hypothetical protein